MKNILLILNIIIFSTLILKGKPGNNIAHTEQYLQGNITGQDTVFLNQLYYNGKVWVGLYYNVYGTEFIIQDTWYKADVIVNGINFEDVSVKYDVYNDEILTNYYNKKIITLNNENIDGFTLYIDDEKLKFRNFRDSGKMKGHYQVIHEGQSKLYKKWRKKRAQFVIEARYDEFQPDDSILIVINDKLYEVKNRRRLLKIMSDKKSEIKSFIRKEKINPDFSQPSSLVPILKYYDTLQLE